MVIKPNYYIITGGPGVGKTTLIDALRRKGYHCVPEVAREIIKEQIENNGNALPWKDTSLYSGLMLQKSVEDFITLPEKDEIYFFDRGIPDTYGYNKLIGLPIDDNLQYATGNYRYNPIVFILPAWTEIYHTDNERKQSLEEAIATYHAMKAAYIELGYHPVDVPKTTVEERCKYVLEKIKTL